MTAFTIVILALLVAINLWNYESLTHQQDSTLQMLSIINEGGNTHFHPGELPMSGSGEHFSPEVQHMMRFFSVTFDNHGSVLHIEQEFIASISKEKALSFAKQILGNQTTNGYVDGYRYLVSRGSQSTTVFFLNAERELQMITSLFQTTGLISICCLAAVFLLIFWLSDRAIAPYIRNLETQKRFITDASHELKTPLTAISTSANVLSLELTDNEWVQNIKCQARQLSKLIGELVMLTKLDEENPFDEKEHFSPKDALLEIQAPFTSFASANNLMFTTEFDDDILLYANKASMQRLLSILLDNSCKYCEPAGSISLHITKKGRATQIIVANTYHLKGTEDLNHVFDRFYCGDPSKNNRNSYGIGLSIAKSIVENHGGHIQASHDGENFIITAVL